MPAFSPLNYINVGPHGTFRESGNLKTNPEDIDAIFEHLEQTGQGKLAVHFHGGLIGEAKGKEIAEKMWKLFKDDAHPVTFVWETGFIETVSRNLNELFPTKLFQKVVKYAIRRAAAKLGGGIGGKGPGEEMTLTEIEAELASVDRFDRFDQGAKDAAAVMDEAELDAIATEIQAEVELDLDADPDIIDILETEPPITELLDPAFVDEVQAEKSDKGFISTAKLALHISKIVYRVIKRFIRKRDHGFYPTVVEETLRELYLADFGAWVWGNMKEIAEAMWQPNTLPLTDDSHPGTYFLEKLAAHQQAHPGFTIDLAGHSAGSIAICHLLDRIEERFPALAIRNLLLLAPACTSELFRQEIAAQPDRFDGFRMFTMKDDLETKDRLVPAVYTRSLLYFISGVLEDTWDIPLAGLELQSRGTAPYDSRELLEVQRFVRAPGTLRLVLSETTGQGPGLNSASHAHGDFDDDTETLTSLKVIVAT